MNIAVDTHTHTLASSHAFSTIRENAEAAAEAGLAAVCMTDHTPALPDAPHIWHFDNLHILPRKICGVTIIRGAEVNIMDADGSIDLAEANMKDVEWIVASMHSPCITPAAAEAQTSAYLGVAKNPRVDVIGHPGSGKYPFDYERCVRAFKEYGKLVEINENALRSQQESPANYTALARLCMKHEVPVVVSSDAHYCGQIGRTLLACRLLEDVGFPERLVLNADKDRFFAFIRGKRGLDLA